MKLHRLNLRWVLVACTGAAGMIMGISQPALATGVDNPMEVFQMEGNPQVDSSICFSLVGTGTAMDPHPATADPVMGMCPTAGEGAWTLVNFAAATEDWNTIYAATPPGMGMSNADAHSFVTDAVNTTADSAFLGTSSKDTDDLNVLTWNPHKAQAKDDISHAFAAAYQSSGKTYIYAGMDRIANNGASTAGFQFVQDSSFAMCTGAGTDTDGPNPACMASGTFVGNHIDGDLLIVSDFTVGGAVPIINIFVWNGGTYPATPDVSVSPAPCDLVLDDSSICGITNNHVIQTQNNKGDDILEQVNTPAGLWSFVGKGGNTDYLTGEILEIGVVLDDIFPEGVPCFSKFFGETRSSNSITASLSDLTSPVSFPLCSISVTKTCTGSQLISKAGGGEAIRYSFSGNINNTGSATVYHPHLKDTVPSMSGAYIAGSLEIPPGTARTPGVFFDLTGTITGGMSQMYTGQLDSNVILSGTTDEVKNFMDATASSDSSGTPQNVSSETTADWGNPGSGACAITITPALALEKLCNTCLVTNGSDLDVQVTEGIALCNTGDVTLTNLVAKDCRGGTWSTSDPSTASCSGSEATVSGLPSSLPPDDGMTNNHCVVVNMTHTPDDCDSRGSGNCNFNDAVIASGYSSLKDQTVTAMQYSTSCAVCPINDSCSDYTIGDFMLGM